jgi:hypothetical protein
MCKSSSSENEEADLFVSYLLYKGLLHKYNIKHFGQRNMRLDTFEYISRKYSDQLCMSVFLTAFWHD